MRVRRRRGVHVLMGTLALVAGCSTAQRAEVSGVVRDRATGRTIAGARVVGSDGSLAETDAEGRFHLYVRGEQADVRITAAGHSPEHLEIEGRETCVELAPLDETWGDTASSATDEASHVVTFVEESWWLDGGTHDGSLPTACAETSLAQAHSEIACASCHAGQASASCGACHADEASVVRGVITSGAFPTAVGAHDALGGGCLACHGETSHGDARAACVRCHGGEARARREEVGGFFALATSSAAGSLEHGTAFEMGSTTSPRLGAEPRADAVRRDLAAWARALARDRSGGVHDPRATLAVGRALDR